MTASSLEPSGVIASGRTWPLSNVTNDRCAMAGRAPANKQATTASQVNLLTVRRVMARERDGDIDMGEYLILIFCWSQLQLPVQTDELSGLKLKFRPYGITGKFVRATVREY